MIPFLPAPTRSSNWDAIDAWTNSTRFLYRKRGYFISSPRSVTDRLEAGAIEFAQIAILIAGLIIASLCTLFAYSSAFAVIVVNTTIGAVST
jgi:hypothetical protein